MKATALAPANIAFIKYWGKSDDELRLPMNPSISMNLDSAYTRTTVEFSTTRDEDEVTLLDGTFSEQEVSRVTQGLDRIRQKAGRTEKARVVTKNTFPKGAGSAASASGFAALTIAGFAALEFPVDEKELTIFARLGSGSACRSIPDGFVEWKEGNTSDESYAVSLYPSSYWDLRDILVIVDSRMKKVSTTEGMETVRTSPFLTERLSAIADRMIRCKEALREKNFTKLGEVVEEDCLDMHHVMQTQIPPLRYWNDATRRIMEATKNWRAQGIPVYFTIDAGPNVHLFCEAKYEKEVLDALVSIKGIESIIVNKPSRGAHLIADHLF